MIAFLESSFEGTRLREKQNAKMRFEIPQQKDKTLGAMFGFIEVCTKLFLGFSLQPLLSLVSEPPMVMVMVMVDPAYCSRRCPIQAP